MLDLLRFPDESRVWIYTSSREFRDEELPALQQDITLFTRQWTSHNQQLYATGGIMHNRFLVLVVDEGQAGASGCSIDSSVHFIQALGQKYQTDFFDRRTFCYLQDEEVRTVPMEQFNEAYRSGAITDNTLFFDTLVQQKGDFINAWIKPLRQSWLTRLIR